MRDFEPGTDRIRLVYAEDRLWGDNVPNLVSFHEFDNWLERIQEDARVAGYLEGYDAGMDEAIEMERQ